MRGTVEERFWAKVNKGAACWLWQAYTGKGYGSFWCGKPVRAHRWAYEQLVGPIPDGLTLDHLCRNRACVNPAHLEPVTNAENVLRGSGPTAVNARRTHCPQGHPLTPDNLRRKTDGSRDCKECHRMRENDRRAANKGGGL